MNSQDGMRRWGVNLHSVCTNCDAIHLRDHKRKERKKNILLLLRDKDGNTGRKERTE
jgi:hypothetical protein